MWAHSLRLSPFLGRLASLLLSMEETQPTAVLIVMMMMMVGICHNDEGWEDDTVTFPPCTMHHEGPQSELNKCKQYQ